MEKNNSAIGENIALLRKSTGKTQEELARAVNVSPQAVSKWETGTCLPDTQTMPLIAQFLGVSIDYLFHGKVMVYSDLYKSIYKATSAYEQNSAEAYNEALMIFSAAFKGIYGGFPGDAKIPTQISSTPIHISGENGVSLLCNGYGALVTRDFFRHIDVSSIEFISKLFAVLGDRDRLTVLSAVISMSDISFTELRDKLGCDEERLNKIIDELTEAGILFVRKSKHESLGMTYDVNDMYHTCLCLMLATGEMQKLSLGGISCVMGYGDYPINIGKNKE